MASIQQQLSTCVDSVLRMRHILESLIGEGANLPELEADARHLLARLHDATTRLSTPSLTLATIGTTSAGKSTVLNAMIGRALAPMRQGETSAGTLTVGHSTTAKARLVIAPTPGAAWECGAWEEITDDEVRERVDRAMTAYFEARKKDLTIQAPDVRIDAGILPGNWRELLDLPANVGIEFIDLPGLNSVNDRANLRVIQSRVKQAACLVVLDYTETDREKRKELLQQLSETVQAFGGRTDTLAFVLNRVDLRNAGEEPVALRLAEFATEVQLVLGLAAAPEIIPITARAVYLAQCAWGPEPFSGTRTASEDNQKTYLGALTQGATGGWLRDRLWEDEDARGWFESNRIEAALRAGTLTADLHRILLGHLYRWSGLRELWGLLRGRVSDRLSVLLLRPILQETLAAIQSFLALARSTAGVRQAASLADLAAEHARLTDLFTDVRVAIDQERAAFEARLGNAVEHLGRFDDPNALRFAVESIPGFKPIVTAVHELKTDLRDGLLTPLEVALQKGHTVKQIRERLSGFSEPKLIDHLVDAYDMLTRGDLALTPSLAQGAGLTVKVREADAAGVQKLEHKQKEFILFNRRVREVLKTRAERFLQVKQGLIEEALVEVLRTQTDAVTARLERALGVGGEVRFAPTPATAATLSLPDDLFGLPDARTTQDKSWEQTGTTTTSTGGCCPETVNKPVYSDVKYRMLQLPNAAALGGQWVEGLRTSEGALWGEILRCLRESSARALDEHLRLLSHAQVVVDMAVAARRQELAGSEKDQRSHWAAVGAALDELTAIRESLHAVAEG